MVLAHNLTYNRFDILCASTIFCSKFTTSVLINFPLEFVVEMIKPANTPCSSWTIMTIHLLHLLF